MNTAIIFDMDGVILDTEPLYTRAEIRLFHEYGVNIPEEDWSLFRGCSEEDFFNLSMQRYKINENRDVFMNKGREYVREEFTNNLAFMPGFHALIRRVKKKHKTGLVTASPRFNIDWLCKQIHLDTIFENIISGSESKYNKPHPAPYLDMIKLLNITSENTIIIEDSINGLRAALNAGAHVIAKTGSVSLENLSMAHRIVMHLDEITDELINDLLQDVL
jgi:HAD superfamily hydrolase (TIGR01509 family)